MNTNCLQWYKRTGCMFSKTEEMFLLHSADEMFLTCSTLSETRCEEQVLTVHLEAWRKQHLMELVQVEQTVPCGPLTVDVHRCVKSRDQEEDDAADFQSDEEPSDEGFHRWRWCCPQTNCCKTSPEPAQVTHMGQMKLFCLQMQLKSSQAVITLLFLQSSANDLKMKRKADVSPGDEGSRPR